MNDVARELERARRSLLDLTLRNRLLNYRPHRLRSIRVIDELPAEIYDALVLRERSLEFRSAERPPSPETKHTDRYLQTPHDDESLSKKLFRVYHEGRSAVEEQGYTVAHLAIAFLEWFESDDATQPRLAPLILVPAELERVRAGDFSKVKWTGEDVFANISLVAKLNELGIALPAFEAPEEKSGIDAWLEKVAAAVAKKARWRVLPEMTLDFFSFTKFVMFKDLDPAMWAEHRLLATLFGGEVEKTPAGLENPAHIRESWQVMDADPSQIAVIEEVKRGGSLVVQGPPGTGKSQTIANLIAETLAAGRSVLFVSEKMAALEVVKSRLDAAGLGPFCLELHSRKANKKAVLMELQRALGSRPLPAPSEQAFDEHELLQRDLDRYATELGAPVGAWGKSPYDLFGIAWSSDVTVEIPNAGLVTPADVVTAENAMRELAYILPSVLPAAAHPWRASTREAMLPHEEEELRTRLARAREAVAAIALAARISGVQPPSHLGDIERAVHAAQVIARAGAPTETALLLSADWNAPNAGAEELVRRVEAFQRERAELGRTFQLRALDGNHGRELDELATLSTKMFRFLNGRYRALRNELAGLYATRAPKSQQMIAELSRLVEHQGVRDALRGDPRGRGYFGSRWNADRSDCAKLREFAEWIVVFRRELLAQALTTDAVQLASKQIDAAAVHASIEQLHAAAIALRDAIRTLLDDLRIDEDAAFGGQLDTIAFAAIDNVIQRWQEQTSALFRWSQFNAARAVLRATAAAPLEPLVMRDALAGDRLIPTFHASLAGSLLRIAFRERPSLAHFAGEQHERKIARFRDLDGSLAAINRARLSRRLHAARPQITGGASPHSEAGILLGEIHRKRGHMPIRRLLAKAGGLIQRIKPCFLMSPLSIAQFLDPHGARFDLIVFDEASQVRPEDALGALLRGSQLVVMGDTQQLPPTSFFDHLSAGDESQDDDEGAAMSDIESVLHQCARSYPTKMLNWHYRSRHESLIAISNLHFYENKLRIYPSPIDRADELGLHFVHVPRAVYDRGRGGTNRIEARAVATAALEHYRRFPDKSLGIGTFNIQQQQAIQEEVESLLHARPEMEEILKRNPREPLFVKNLETIQGDERDTILISIGFGRDEAGKLSLNFGPVNRDGGERRLNVLISRAREKCVVYSNFRANELVLDGSNSKGLFALKSFLDFAETRRLPVMPDIDDEQPSAFENAVAEALCASGYEVKQRAGCAGFRVDVAVVDREQPGRYMLAVECDGPKYYTSTEARDRDRLRQQVLENLGWRVHRVWSTDWYRNREETLARLLDAAAEPPAPAPGVILSPAEGEGPVAIVDDFIPPADTIEPYESCRTLRIPTIGELHLVPTDMLAVAVEDVVAIEGPVHIDEVVRRIRTIWGLQRAGNRIREAIERGVATAVRRGVIDRHGDFLQIPNAAVRPRRRNGDPPPRIDLISDAELAEAIRHVLRVQFSTPREELIDAAARRLGILATTAPAAARIAAVLDHDTTLPR